MANTEALPLSELEHWHTSLREKLTDFPNIYFGHYAIARGTDGFNHIADAVTLASPVVNQQEQQFYRLLAEYAAIGLAVCERRAALEVTPTQAVLAPASASVDDLDDIEF